MRHLNRDAILWCGKHFFLKRVLIRLTTKSGCNYIWQPAKTIHHFLFFSQTKVGKMLKQYCTTSENHLKFCSNTLTQEAFKNLYYTFYNVGRPFYVVATFSTNFERTVVKENVETVYKGLWTRSRLGLLTDLRISTSLYNFSALVKNEHP